MNIVYDDDKRNKVDYASLREDNINSFISDSIVLDGLNSIMSSLDKDETTLTDIIFNIAKTKGFEDEESLTAIGTIIADNLEKIGVSESLIDEAFSDEDIAIDSLADIRSFLLETEVEPLEVTLDNELMFDWYCGDSAKPKTKYEGGRKLVTKPSHCTKADGTIGKYSRVPVSGTGKKYKHSNKKASDKQKEHWKKIHEANKANKEASNKRVKNRTLTIKNKSSNKKKRV